MVIYWTCGLLLAYMALPALLLGDLAFRCPSCTAELLAVCPKVAVACAEIVREPGCGCCPMCARLDGETCGVYTPRCSTGLRCYPTAGAEFPLQQLIQGMGRCQSESEASTSLANEVHGTASPREPLTKRPVLDAWLRQAREQHKRNNKMKMNQLEEQRVQKMSQGVCEEELNMVMEEISKITSEDNRGPLENLYGLKFPNCDRQGLYNLKQCNMSTHGQRGECWCVNPLTGVQIPTTPLVRGDPNCYQFQEEVPTPATSR